MKFNTTKNALDERALLQKTSCQMTRCYKAQFCGLRNTPSKCDSYRSVCRMHRAEEEQQR